MKKIFAITLAILVIFSQTAFAANNPSEFSGWNKSFWQSPNDTAIDTENNYMKVTTDKELVCEGNGSFVIHIDKQMDNLNFQAAQNVDALETGKKYVIKGKFNVPSDSWRYRLMFGNEPLVNIGTIVGEYGKWSDAEYEFEFKSASKEFRIQSCGAGELMADSLSLKEVIYDEDSTSVLGYGEELLSNGDFEDGLDLTPPAEVTAIAAENKDGSAVLSWKNPPDKDFAAVYVYDITNGRTLLLKTAGQRIELSGLENGKVYTYLICTADSAGNISGGVTAEACPVADSLKLTEPEFYINGAKTSKIGAGKLSAKAKLKNNAMSEDYSAELILVVLKDGAIYDISSQYKIIELTDENMPYTELCTELTVPEGEGFSAEIYLWDSITGMKAQCDKLTLE